MANVVPASLPRIRLQLLSELRFHLGRQAEVLTLRVTGTNLVTQSLEFARSKTCRTQTARHPDVPNLMCDSMGRGSSHGSFDALRGFMGILAADSGKLILYD
jgi:hypothetical protein